MFLMAVGANQFTVIAGVLFQFEALLHVAAHTFSMSFLRKLDFEWPVRVAVANQALR